MMSVWKVVVAVLTVAAFTAGFLFFLSRNNSLEAPTDGASSEEQEIENEIGEKTPSFPFYYGVSVNDREYQRTDGGYLMTVMLDESVENIIFWYYDELENEGWSFTSEPDIANERQQAFSAVGPTGERAEVTAKNVGSATELTIMLYHD